MPNFIVKLQPDAPWRETAADLSRIGLDIYREIPDFGVISGSASTSVAEKINALPSVKRVRREDSFQLPPVDSALPQ